MQESQDKNTLEPRILKNVLDQKNQLQLRFGLLGGFIRCVKNLVIVGWSIGVQLTWWTIHQTWTLVYVGIKKGNNKWTLQSQ